MAYVGNSPTQQSFTGGVDQYNGNNSNTAFGLTRTINTVYDVDVYVENVWQRPTTGYTVSANTITFTSAPPAGSNNVVVVYRSFSATSIVPQQGSVTHTAFAANAIPTALGYMPANKAGDTFSGAVSGITTLAAGNTTITGTANVSQGLTSNTLTVSTNTATFGNTLYSLANGNIGIGTNTPSGKLDVKIGSYTRLSVSSDTYAGVVIGRRIADDSYATLTFSAGGATSPKIEAAGTDLSFYTNNTFRGGFSESGNFQFNSGYGSAAIAYGCRAWLNVRGDCTINGSGNISSVTDVGGGYPTQYMRIAFTSAMPDKNYNIVTGGGGYLKQYMDREASSDTDTSYKTTGQFEIDIYGTSTTSDFHIAIFR